MAEDLPDETTTANSRPPRDSLGSLFGQVAATTVRNILDGGVATLEKLDKMLAERVAQFNERRKQLKVLQNEDERQHVIETMSSIPLEGNHLSIENPHDLMVGLYTEHRKDDAVFKLHNEEHLKDDWRWWF